MESNRKYYLDNIRLFVILLLIPFHTMMMFNIFGEGQYVPATPSVIISFGISMLDPWFMKVLFVIAGIVACYSLNQRSPGKFIRERLLRIGLPLIAGVVLLTPFISYIADVVNNGYSDGYFEHYTIFFTKVTDFSGYDGGFAASHLWFLAFLFVISLAALAIYFMLKKIPIRLKGDKWFIVLLIFLGVLQAFSQDWLIIGGPVSGKSLSQSFFLFLIGMFILSQGKVQAKLEKFRFPLLFISLAFGVGYGILLTKGVYGFGFDVVRNIYGYMLILALLGIGGCYLNSNNKFLLHIFEGSMLFYVLHYPIHVGVSYLLLPYLSSIPLQFVAIMSVSFIVTCCATEIVRAIPGLRTLFGMKTVKKNLVQETPIKPC